MSQSIYQNQFNYLFFILFFFYFYLFIYFFLHQCSRIHCVPHPLAWRQDVQVSCRADAGTCDVQLAMAEHAVNQVNASYLQCLPLRLVDRHGIAHPDQELDPLELEALEVAEVVSVVVVMVAPVGFAVGLEVHQVLSFLVWQAVFPCPTSNFVEHVVKPIQYLCAVNGQ